jgi:hypothetical protein
VRTVRFGTFDAESWWRPRHLATLPAAPDPGRAAVAAMDHLLAGLCDADDLLITRHPLPDALRAGLHAAGIDFHHRSVTGPDDAGVEALLVDDRPALDAMAGYRSAEPWAVVPDTARVAEAAGLPAGPPVDVVATVNSKTWSHRLAAKLDLPGAGRLVRSVAGLREAVEATGYDAVVKDPYGVSGRSTLAVSTPGVLRAVARTLSRHPDREVELIVQPRYRVRSDFSGQLRIDPDGSTRVLGVTLLRNDGFRYAGSEPAPPGLVRELAARGYPEVLETVGEQLAAAGYHGPAGVDSMLLTDGTLIPVLEVNARCTLGLLTLRLAERWGVHGHSCRLRQTGVAPGRGLADVVAELDARGTAYRGGARPGIVVLGGGAGRIHYAAVGEVTLETACRSASD